MDKTEMLLEKIKRESELAEQRYTEHFAKNDFKIAQVNSGMIHALAMVRKWQQQNEDLTIKMSQESDLAEKRYTEHFKKDDFETAHVNSGMVHAFAMVKKWQQQIQAGQNILCDHANTKIVMYKGAYEFCGTYKRTFCLDCETYI